MVMATINEDKMLAELSDSIDSSLLEWMTAHKIPPLNLTAVILARLTWLAKMGGYENDFLQLLEAPQNIINQSEENKVMH